MFLNSQYKSSSNFVEHTKAVKTLCGKVAKLNSGLFHWIKIAMQ